MILIVEASIIPFFAIQGIAPDLKLVFLVFICLKESRSASTIAGFVAGLMQDIFTISTLGVSSLSKSIVCFLTSFFRSVSEDYSTLFIGAIVFLAVGLQELIYQLIHAVGTEGVFFRMIFVFIIPKSIYTAIWAIFIHLILSRRLWKKPTYT
jgi:rod shape-determining protein MreD